MITKSEEHEINRDGKRLLREVMEPLGWVVNDVQEDYGIDTNVQVFDGKSPTGAWFHVQLKSSACTAYSADRSFVSQELSIDHARHFALEMRQPVFLVHVDVATKIVYWHAPQLDRRLEAGVGNSETKSITVRMPTRQQLPDSAADLLTSIDKIHLALAIRTLTSTSAGTFAQFLTHLPNQEALYRASQDKHDTLKLRKIRELFDRKEFDQARLQVQVVLADPDPTVEIKFWAQIQLQAIDYVETVEAGKPQNELAKLQLMHAKTLQKLTASGPKNLKFYSLIARHAARLGILAHERFSLMMALKVHLQRSGNPMMVLGLFARQSVATSRFVSEYNRCVRLAKYAANYPDRWVLGRALTNIVAPMGSYLVTLRAENNSEAERAFAQSALQISKLAAWISEEAGDSEGVVLAIISALLTTGSTESEAYLWANQVAQALADSEIRADALRRIERAVRRWKGEKIEGDYHGDTVWQAFQNIATGLGIDVEDETNPLVQGLRIAAKDDSPERILRHCEHLLVVPGATGPIARQIQAIFNVTTAASKVIHCTLHNVYVEGKEQDVAHEEFKEAHCNSCPDRKPRPEDWRYTENEIRAIRFRHSALVSRIVGTPSGLRYTDHD